MLGSRELPDGGSAHIRAGFEHLGVHPKSGYAMTTIPDAQLYAHSGRLHGKVVLITGGRIYRSAPAGFAHFFRCTGGAAGIGRETALRYARSKCVFAFGPKSRAMINPTENVGQFHRAKLVLGDLNKSGLDDVVAEIRRAGGYVWPHFSRLE